jgi:hypothetical protein
MERQAGGAELSKATGGAELCVKEGGGGTVLRNAPLAGALCVFEHPREAGERELAWLAERQHWCLHRRQLQAGGVGRKGIRGRITRGQLHPLLSDVFLYGRREQTPLTLAMAVVLHLRGDGLISGEAATWIWELTDLRPDQVIATLAGRSTSAIEGVELHRVRALHPDDVRWRRGIPLTSPARAMADFAGSGASIPRIESAFAMLRRISTDRQIRAALARLPANHPGAPLMRHLLELPPGELVLTKSLYERKLRELIGQAGLTAPISNLPVAGRERDLVWPEAKLIVEFDSWEFHRHRFRDDRARDAKAVALGWRVIRLTADRVDLEPLTVIAEIAAALAVAA